MLTPKIKHLHLLEQYWFSSEGGYRRRRRQRRTPCTVQQLWRHKLIANYCQQRFLEANQDDEYVYLWTKYTSCCLWISRIQSVLYVWYSANTVGKTPDAKPLISLALCRPSGCTVKFTLWRHSPLGTGKLVETCSTSAELACKCFNNILLKI